MSSYDVQAFSKHSDIKEHPWTMSEAGKHAEIAGKHFTKGLGTIFALILILMTHLGNKFAHVTAAKLSWYVKICYLIWSPFFM